MMPSAHFTDEMNRLREGFGNNAFNMEKVKRIAVALRDLPEKAITDIVNALLDNFKHAPTPADFQVAASAWRRSNGYHNIQAEEVSEPISCLGCYETGWMFIRLNESEPIKLVGCHCKFGTRELDKIRINEGITYVPRWEETQFLSLGFIKIPFPYKMFVPNSDEQKKIFESTSVHQLQMNDIVKRWQSKIRDSIDYWNKKVNTHQEGA